MSSLSDTVSVAVVLILLFGAVSMYLYTRVQQCEKKLNLVESILLDIKMSAELRDYPDIPFKDTVSIPVSVASGAAAAGTSFLPPTPPSPPRQVIPFEDVADTHVEAHSATQSVHMETLPSIDEMHESSEPMRTAGGATAAAAAGAAAAPAPSRVSVGANYESMTLSELKALAQQRNITGAKSMKRNQILEALRTSDRAAETSSFLSSTEPLVAPSSDVEGFSPLEGTTLTEIHA
jgi:hypothetical protein